MSDTIELRRSQRNKAKSAEETTTIPKKPAIEKNNQIITPIQMSNIIWSELTSKNLEISVGVLV